MIFPQISKADTIQDDIQLNTSVPDTCMVHSISTIPLIQYNAFSNIDVRTNFNIKVLCTKSLKYAEAPSFVLRLSEGLHSDTGSSCETPIRRLKENNSDNFLSYKIVDGGGYEYACGTTLLDNGSYYVPVVLRFAYNLNELKQPNQFPLRILIPKAQNSHVGNYSDTITVSVDF